jgi:dCMP deaminase
VRRKFQDLKDKLKQAYMKTAETFAELSHARRLHVGAIVVKDDRIISIGYNGMPAGWDNDCEDEISANDGEYRRQLLPKTSGQWESFNLKTKPEVLHAETNAIAKLARSSDSGLGADLFVTHSPCLDCAKLIYQSGIKRVWYGAEYRNSEGIDFLRRSGVEVENV